MNQVNELERPKQLRRLRHRQCLLAINLTLMDARRRGGLRFLCRFGVWRLCVPWFDLLVVVCGALPAYFGRPYGTFIPFLAGSRACAATWPLWCYQAVIVVFPHLLPFRRFPLGSRLCGARFRGALQELIMLQPLPR